MNETESGNCRAIVRFEPKPDHIYNFDALQLLELMPDESVNCIVSSPPYFGLRDYGVDGQIGLEPTPAEYVASLVRVFREARRVLRRDGVLWLNLGDSYANDDKWGGATGGKHAGGLHGNTGIGRTKRKTGFKPKDRLMIPARVALALQADGWWLRDEIVWSKPNAMPASVTDRTTSAHEMIYLLTKSARYWYDAEAIKEPLSEVSIKRIQQPNFANQQGGPKDYANGVNPNRSMRKTLENFAANQTGSRNKRSVWEVATQPFPAAHFAVFPEALVEPMVLAGCPAQVCSVCGRPWSQTTEPTGHVNKREPAHAPNSSPTKTDSTGWAHTRRATGEYKPTCNCNAVARPGLCLDPFMGAGTTAVVAHKLGRHFIGSELNPEYVELARMRVAGRLGEYLARQRGEAYSAYMFDDAVQSVEVAS